MKKFKSYTCTFAYTFAYTYTYTYTHVQVKAAPSRHQYAPIAMPENTPPALGCHLVQNVPYFQSRLVELVNPNVTFVVME